MDQDQYEIELIDLLRVIWRRKWIIIAVTALIVGLIAGFAATRTPTYQATITMSLDNRAPEFATALNTAESAAGRHGSASLPGKLADWPSLCLSAKPSFADPQGDTFTVQAIWQGPDVVFTLSRRGSHAISEAIDAWTPWVQETVTDRISHDLELLRSALAEDLSQQEAILAEIVAVLPEEAFLDSSAAGSDPSASTEAFADQLAAQQLRVAQDRVALATLDSLTPQDLFTSEEQGRTDAVVISTGLVTYLALGIVLGLLFGVLFAFFIDYLIRARKRDR